LITSAGSAAIKPLWASVKSVLSEKGSWLTRALLACCVAAAASFGASAASALAEKI